MCAIAPTANFTDLLPPNPILASRGHSMVFKLIRTMLDEVAAAAGPAAAGSITSTFNATQVSRDFISQTTPDTGPATSQKIPSKKRTGGIPSSRAARLHFHLWASVIRRQRRVDEEETVGGSGGARRLAWEERGDVGTSDKCRLLPPCLSSPRDGKGVACEEERDRCCISAGPTCWPRQAFGLERVLLPPYRVSAGMAAGACGSATVGSMLPQPLRILFGCAASHSKHFGEAASDSSPARRCLLRRSLAFCSLCDRPVGVCARPRAKNKTSVWGISSLSGMGGRGVLVQSLPVANFQTTCWLTAFSNQSFFASWRSSRGWQHRSSTTGVAKPTTKPALSALDCSRTFLLTIFFPCLQDPTVIDAPAPRPDQLPMGASRNTWPNIVNNKRSIIFCTTQFHYLKNRENCIHDFTGGPLLA